MGQALQADAPRPAWYFPAGQTTHAIAPPTENSPKGQAAQSEGSAEPGEATDVPAGHATQARDCGTSWKEPGGQSVQEALVGMSEKAPAGQATQRAAPAIPWYWPAGQLRQLVDPALEYLPIPQVAQPPTSNTPDEAE